MDALQDEIAFKGVVFNEMKGVYSQPDSVNGTVTQQALFPDNSYAVDSGGNPTVIPDLTFEEFRVRACHTSTQYDLGMQSIGVESSSMTHAG